MNVLLLTQVLPYPLDSGPKIKTYHVIKYLAQRHRLTLVSFVRGDQSECVRHLKRYCEAVYTAPMERGVVRDALAMARSLLAGKSWMTVRDDRAEMRRLVDQLTAERHFDVVHVDQLNMAQYAERVDGAFKVLDAHNALWLLYKRLWQTMSPGLRKLLLGRDWRLLKSYEGRLVREFDAVLAVSQEDKAALQQAAGQSVDIIAIPIAIDTDEVTVVERVEAPRHILHIGTMYWPPNIDGVDWFINEIYPFIRQQRPDVEFDVVGSRPPERLLALNDVDLGINVTGYVQDPTPYLERTGVMVVPLLAGGGMRVKILNALAQGLPIVSTSLGCEGIAVTHSQDIMIADSPYDFAEAVLEVLDDPKFAVQLGHNGRRLAEQQYDYRQACRPMDVVYERATRPRP